MNQQPAGSSEASSRTLADILDAVLASETLAEKRRAALASSVRSVGRLLNRSLADLPAHMSVLRERLSEVHPIQAGISQKRFDHVLSEL